MGFEMVSSVMKTDEDIVRTVLRSTEVHKRTGRGVADSVEHIGFSNKS